MQARDKNYYIALRSEYKPKSVTLVIVAESPPVSGLYFYDNTGTTSEPLFVALMKQLGFHANKKEDGLREFQRVGWILVDATYEPVNAPNANRDKIIKRDYPCLCKDLTQLSPCRSVPIILIKANVCRLLEPKLKACGFNVINNGRKVPFPAQHHQKEFQSLFRDVLQSADLKVTEK